MRILKSSDGTSKHVPSGDHWQPFVKFSCKFVDWYSLVAIHSILGAVDQLYLKTQVESIELASSGFIFLGSMTLAASLSPVCSDIARLICSGNVLHVTYNLKINYFAFCNMVGDLLHK